MGVYRELQGGARAGRGAPGAAPPKGERPRKMPIAHWPCARGKGGEGKVTWGWTEAGRVNRTVPQKHRPVDLTVVLTCRRRIAPPHLLTSLSGWHAGGCASCCERHHHAPAVIRTSSRPYMQEHQRTSSTCGMEVWVSGRLGAFLLGGQAGAPEDEQHLGYGRMWDQGFGGAPAKTCAGIQGYGCTGIPAGRARAP